MSDGQDDSPHVIPPIADLSGREGPVPGPLTKPLAIPRPLRRRRPRWMLLAVSVLVLVAVAVIIWWLSL